MTIDHVALETKDIPASVKFYTERFDASVLYQDDSWAFLKFGATKLALVTPGQHPMHVAISVTEDQLDAEAKKENAEVDAHRDGTKGIYLKDPSGNDLELICYPKGETDYAKGTQSPTESA